MAKRPKFKSVEEAINHVIDHASVTEKAVEVLATKDLARKAKLDVDRDDLRAGRDDWQTMSTPDKIEYLKTAIDALLGDELD